MKKQLLKNWEISLLLALCITLCAGTWAGARSEALGRLIRLHVVASTGGGAGAEAPRGQRLAIWSRGLAAERRRGGGVHRDELDGPRRRRGRGRGPRAAVTLGRDHYPTGLRRPPAGRESCVSSWEGRGNWWCVVFRRSAFPQPRRRRPLRPWAGTAQLLGGGGRRRRVRVPPA
ncbi:MAG: hypothetical protein ACLUEK_09720 [Oscillospiraceae bacterium]